MSVTRESLIFTQRPTLARKSRWSGQNSLGSGTYPTIEMDWARPIVAGIELKASNLEAQQDFYTQVSA